MNRPPWAAVLLFLAAALGAGWWAMSHAYDLHDPGECGARYAAARTAADTAAADGFVPDSERQAAQPRSCGALRAPTAREFAVADSLLSRAIAATGGDSALAHLRTIAWQGTATTGDSASAVVGIWRVLPPDSEVVTTWRTADSAATARRLVVTPASVWAESNGDSVELTPAERAAERQLVYDFGLARLVPLLEPGTRYRPLAPDAAGRPGLRVTTPGRLDAELRFGGEGRLEEIGTTAAPAPGAHPSTTTVSFAGTTEIAGVRWFREMRVARDGRPVLALTVTAPLATR